MPGCYVPDVGDIVWMDFNPQRGHEQAGRRPAVVLSPKVYNAKTGLLLCVPVTRSIKGYPFEVLLSSAGTSGVALSDQVKSMDWRIRNAERQGAATSAEMTEIKAKIRALITPDE
ncbi:MAG: endoribonuclease MazF [Candidatus Competibacteraceae bacterium]|nr:endoribonuclease MazF [Candidatus Competibacteraceae bacterium]